MKKHWNDKKQTAMKASSDQQTKKNFINKLDEILTKKIKGENVNLIKYISNKESISDILISQISESNEDKITKMDKVCKINDII